MLVHWLWFAMLPGVTDNKKRILMEHFSDPEELFNDKLTDLEELDARTVEALSNRDLTVAEKVLSVCRRKDIGIIPYNDSRYPRRLRNIPDPPMVLYYTGNLPDFDKRLTIAVVGTRKASAYGMNAAYSLSRELAASGVLVVSGGAAGIDTTAMEAALQENMPAVGVLGCGVDVVYPRNNRKLFARVTQSGCLISEFPPGTPPYAWNFPKRNRILSGISNGVLVVEAPEKSGALITAEYAIEQGRELFVVPGNIGVTTSVGSNGLLREYAAAVCCGWDIVRDYVSLYPETLQKYESQQETPAKVAQLLYQPKNANADSDKKVIDNKETTPYSKTSDPNLTQDEQKVLACLGYEPIPVDNVLSQVELPAGKALATLTMLSVRGVVMQHPGGMVSLKRTRL